MSVLVSFVAHAWACSGDEVALRGAYDLNEMDDTRPMTSSNAAVAASPEMTIRDLKSKLATLIAALISASVSSSMLVGNRLQIRQNEALVDQG